MVVGIALFAVDVLRGDAKAGFVLIVPYVIGGGLYSFFGILCIIGAFLMLFFGLARSGWLGVEGTGGFGSWGGEEDVEDDMAGSPGGEGKGKAAAGKKADTKTGASKRYGGVVLIGPFPVIFGSDRKMALVVAALTIIFLVIMFIFVLYILRF
jgi:uncharacterized protein (TIGR00304 family)